MPLKRRSNSGDGVKFAVRKSKGSSEGFESKYKNTDRADRKEKSASGKFRRSSDDFRNEETESGLADRKVKRGIGKSKGSSEGFESKYKNNDRADRKEKSAGGKFRRPSDDFNNEETASGLADRKVKRGIGKSKQSNDGFRNVDYKENKSRKVQSRGNGNDAALYGMKNEKSGKIHDKGQRDSKTKSAVMIDGNYGGKRKRAYGEAGVLDEKKFNRKSFSKPEPYPDEGKNRMGQISHDHETVGKNKSYDGSRTFTRDEYFGRRNARDKLKGGVELKRVRFSRLGNRTMKKSIRSNLLLQTNSDTNRGKYVTDSADRPQRNKFQGKKSFATDSELKEDTPKKKQRVIRVDPYDISNKRLDDTITDNGNSEDKKDVAEARDAEMSKNAQFRAIIPSPSILSFVDDNLLGRRRDIEIRRAGYNIELPAPLDNIPSSTDSSERERIEVPVFRNKLEFFAAAKISTSFPPPDLPEIAFAGRSNVGKSSLLNALTRQWGVARTSDKPGLTQTINFFNLGPKLSLVDLPGYGFAYAKEEVKDSWEELVKEYVASRATLKRVCLLVDTKWGLKPRDYELIDLMERSETKYQIVLTKTDLVFPIDVARRAMQIEENLKKKKSAVQPLMMASSRTGAGIRSLRTALANIVRFVK